MNTYSNILAKSIDYGNVTLYDHLKHVKAIIIKMADVWKMNTIIAINGALLHDIGKVHPVFQKRLNKNMSHLIDRQPFRHEVSSLFFLPLLNKKYWNPVIEMIIAHHKSILKDSSLYGLLDFNDEWDINKILKFHLGDFYSWSKIALEILKAFKFKVKKIKKEDAKDAFWYAIHYCDNIELGWSPWRGLMIASDYLASALGNKVYKYKQKLFIQPDLSFYQRKNNLYPLSKVSDISSEPHTIVKAPTGAGKTDFLLRRCRNRIFYTLPYQASINAMYQRIKDDLKNTNVDIRLLHAASKIVIHHQNIEERLLQNMAGSSIKILTPHQMASIVFGTRGYEAIIMDIKECDVILDEIHTYTDISQAIVIKLVEILKNLNCRIHIGTATMPTSLYIQILKLLGEKNVYQVKLSDKELKTFNRHIIHKLCKIDECFTIIEKAIKKDEKVLIVFNQVKRSQDFYNTIQKKFPYVKKMLIHSRFRRSDRAKLERQLQNDFNNSKNGCIVLSTQIVEVSLDISFDIMITETAPMDSLIQRFGRINRKRSQETIGLYKHVYVISPPNTKKEARPYEFDEILRSYNILPDGELLEELKIQKMIDAVYPKVNTRIIDNDTIFSDGKFYLKKLTHRPNSVLMELLDISIVSCITQKDVEKYKKTDNIERINQEIPISYKIIAFRGLDQLNIGNKPFIIPDNAYDSSIGLLNEKLDPANYSNIYQFI